MSSLVLSSRDMIRYLLIALCSGMVERVYWRRLVARGFGLIDDVEPGTWRPRPAFTLHFRMNIHGFVRLLCGPCILKSLRADPSRLVRIEAAWSTLNPVEREPNSYQEVLDWLRAIGDQPAGALRYGQKALAEGKRDEAEQWMRKGVVWDPSASAHYICWGEACMRTELTNCG